MFSPNVTCFEEYYETLFLQGSVNFEVSNKNPNLINSLSLWSYAWCSKFQFNWCSSTSL